MARLLVQILCLSQLIILVCSTEYETCDEVHSADQSYDLNGLLQKSILRFQKAKKFTDETVNQRLNYPKFRNFLFEPSTNLYQNSTKCFSDLLYTVQNLKNAANPWALQMFDSYGKPESGILQGNLKWYGDYSECIQIQAPPKPNSTAGHFHGKYCSLTLSFVLANFSLSMTSGVCIPSTCSPPEVQGDNHGPLNITDDTSASNETKPILQISNFKCKATERHLNFPAKAVIALLSVFCALAVLGSSITVVKYFKKSLRKFWQEPSTLVVDSPGKVHIGDQADSLQDENSDDELLLQSDTPLSDFLGKCQTFLNCFCIFQNGAKILNTSTGEGELLCIHGIRFLSMSWVILGHTYAFCFSQTKNIVEAIKLIDNFPFQIILQGFYSVDSFFVLSGFLLTYLSMQQFAKKKGEISWPYFYIHRYIRLTPVYMFTLAFSASVYFYLGSGPFWPDGNLDPNCKESWWWNLLYINNFKNMADQCMGWAWYLANDMQFFIISPIFLISLWRWPQIGYCLLAIFLCASFLANFFITYQFDLPCAALGVTNKSLNITEAMANYMIYMDKIYTKPYTRIGPYLIGILVAYLLFRRKMSNKPKYSWIVLLFGWIVASSITLACIYGLYHRELPLITRSMYNAFNRTCFAMGLSWVIYVCLIRQGGFVNSILSYKFFIPLSRLTYVAYLIHPMIITGYFSSLKTALEFSHPTLVCLFLGMLVTTYAFALPVTLVFESPVISLEKLVRNTFIKNQRTESSN